MTSTVNSGRRNTSKLISAYLNTNFSVHLQIIPKPKSKPKLNPQPKMIDLKTAKLSFNVLLIVQVFLLFFIDVVNFTSSSDETSKTTSTSLYDLVNKPVDKGKLLQLFIGPLNLVGLIYSASTHFTLLLLYIPVRWTLAAYLVAACTARQPLLYSGGLLLEVMIETALGLFIWRLWQQKKRTGGDNTQQTSDLPHQKDPHPFDKQKAGQVSITVFDSLPLPSYLEAVRENPGPQKTTLPKH